MAKANKTVETQASVEEFLARVEPPQRVADARVLIDLMQRISGELPKLWGPSIIGFGSVRYRYESGREGDTTAIAFSPRKAELVLYVGASTPNIAALLPGLGTRQGRGASTSRNSLMSMRASWSRSSARRGKTGWRATSPSRAMPARPHPCNRA